MDEAVFIILIFNISLDVFVMMMEKGATILKLESRKTLLHSLIFAFIDTGLFMSGHWISLQMFTAEFQRSNHVLLTIIFLSIGLKIVIETLKKHPFEEKLDVNFNYNTSIKNAFLSGIDCFLIGLGKFSIGFGFLQQSFIVFLLTFLVAFGAMYIGYYQGAAYQKGLRYYCGLAYLFLAMCMILRLS